MGCLPLLCCGLFGGRGPEVIKLNNAARKEIHRLEKEIMELFLNNAKVELFIVNSKEQIIYHSDSTSITTVDSETLIHYTQHLKSSVIQFSRNLNNDKTSAYYSTHIKGSLTIFSLYSLEIGYDIAFYTRLPSDLHVYDVNLSEVDFHMMSILQEMTNTLEYLNNE